jgi:hypothetical protein
MNFFTYSIGWQDHCHSRADLIWPDGPFNNKKYLFAQGGSQTPHPFFLPTSFLYVNLVAREHRMSFRTLAPWLTVLDIPYFADAYSRTVRPLDLHNF